MMTFISLLQWKALPRILRLMKWGCQSMVTFAAMMVMGAQSAAANNKYTMLTPSCRAHIVVDEVTSRHDIKKELVTRFSFTVEDTSCEFLSRGGQYQSGDLHYVKMVAMDKGVRLVAFVGKSETVTDEAVIPYAQYQIMNKENQMLFFFNSGIDQQPMLFEDDDMPMDETPFAPMNTLEELGGAPRDNR